MRKISMALIMSAGLLGGLHFWSVARAEDATSASDRSTAGLSYRASDLKGMPVKNAASESLGKVEDLVIDLKTGGIRYVVLSFGGFLGVGDKYFAVPFKALRMEGDANGKHWHMVLDADKERLKNAPGFPKDDWPDFANPAWDKSDQFYAVPTAVKTSPPSRKK